MAKELYLKPWDYHKSILLDKLEQYIESIGGELCGYYTPGIIHLTNHEDGTEYATRETNHADWSSGYTSFILNGEYFYVQLESNPFLEFYFQRIEVDENKKYIGSYYLNEMQKNFVLDSLFSFTTNEIEIEKAFELFKNEVMNLPKSKRVYETKRKRVPNYYSGKGYHYENIDVSDKCQREIIPRKACNW